MPPKRKSAESANDGGAAQVQGNPPIFQTLRRRAMDDLQGLESVSGLKLTRPHEMVDSRGPWAKFYLLARAHNNWRCAKPDKYHKIELDSGKASLFMGYDILSYTPVHIKVQQRTLKSGDKTPRNPQYLGMDSFAGMSLRSMLDNQVRLSCCIMPIDACREGFLSYLKGVLWPEWLGVAPEDRDEETQDSITEEVRLRDRYFNNTILALEQGGPLALHDDDWKDGYTHSDTGALPDIEFTSLPGGGLDHYFQLPLWDITSETLPVEAVGILERFLGNFQYDMVPIVVAAWAALVYFWILNDDDLRLEGCIADAKKQNPKADYSLPQPTLEEMILYFPHYIRRAEVDSLAVYPHPFRFVGRSVEQDIAFDSVCRGKKGADSIFHVGKGMIDQVQLRDLLSSILEKAPSTYLIPACMRGSFMTLPTDDLGRHLRGPHGGPWLKSGIPTVYAIGFPAYPNLSNLLEEAETANKSWECVMHAMWVPMDWVPNHYLTAPQTMVLEPMFYLGEMAEDWGRLGPSVIIDSVIWTGKHEDMDLIFGGWKAPSTGLPAGPPLVDASANETTVPTRAHPVARLSTMSQELKRLQDAIKRLQARHDQLEKDKDSPTFQGQDELMSVKKEMIELQMDESDTQALDTHLKYSKTLPIGFFDQEPINMFSRQQLAYLYHHNHRVLMHTDSIALRNVLGYKLRVTPFGLRWFSVDVGHAETGYRLSPIETIPDAAKGSSLSPSLRDDFKDRFRMLEAQTRTGSGRSPAQLATALQKIGLFMAGDPECTWRVVIEAVAAAFYQIYHVNATLQMALAYWDYCVTTQDSRTAPDTGTPLAAFHVEIPEESVTRALDNATAFEDPTSRVYRSWMSRKTMAYTAARQSDFLGAYEMLSEIFDKVKVTWPEDECLRTFRKRFTIGRAYRKFVAETNCRAWRHVLPGYVEDDSASDVRNASMAKEHAEIANSQPVPGPSGSS